MFKMMIYFILYLLDWKLALKIHSIFSQQLFFTSCSMPMWNQLNLLIFVKFEKIILLILLAIVKIMGRQV
jgi:hypothetical protein